MPPKIQNATKAPYIPLDPLYRIAATVDLAEIERNHPVFRLLQHGFREATAFNEEAKELIQETVAEKIPTTPKKKREQMNQVVKIVDDTLLPPPLDFDQSVELFSSPVISGIPSKASAVTLLSQKTLQATPTSVARLAYSNAVTPSFNKSVPVTPTRIPKPPVAKAKLAPKNYVPKVAIVHRKNPAEIDQKAKEDLQKAEERRLQQLAEKAERIRSEREDRDARARERRQQIAEDKKLAATKGFQYKNSEYAPRSIFSPKKVAKDKEMITPRQVHVPMKKGNMTNSVAESTVFDKTQATAVASPVLKRKISSKKTTKMVQQYPEPMQEQESPPMVDSYEDNQIAEDSLAEAELCYEIVDEREALEITNACRGESSLFSSFAQHEAEIHQQKKSTQKSEIVNFDKTVSPKKSIVKTKPVAFKKTKSYVPADQTYVEITPLQEIQNENIVEETDILQQPPPIINVIKQEPLNLLDNDSDKLKKKWLPSTVDNYNIDDLDSADNTDDEDKPRKEVPKWAKPRQLKPAVFDLEKRLTIEERAKLLGPIIEPTLQSIFGRKLKIRMRQSSCEWNSPFSNPTPGFSRLPR